MRVRRGAASLALITGLTLAPTLTACSEDGEQPGVNQEDGGEDGGGEDDEGEDGGDDDR